MTFIELLQNTLPVVPDSVPDKEQEIAMLKSLPFDELMDKLIHSTVTFAINLAIAIFVFYLGKFIYLLDAYDDVEEDVKNKDYNPFAEKYTMEGFEGEVRQILMMMMAETCREFEKLPIIKYGDILRNILYSGVWCRFEEVSRKRREEREKEHVGSI